MKCVLKKQILKKYIEIKNIFKNHYLKKITNNKIFRIMNEKYI